jgi:putative transposase
MRGTNTQKSWVSPDPSQVIDERRQSKEFGQNAPIKSDIDITRFVTLDNVVHYIYLVVDNFSRKILSWFIADRVSALIRRQTIGEALRGLKNEDEHLVLITDGGPENALKEYLQNLNAAVIHQRALIDVHCSNSLIEAHNKLIKYNYLFKMSVSDLDHLRKLIPWITSDFNSRPHISLDGLTPSEKYENASLDTNSLRTLKVKALQKRKEYNFKNRCVNC